MLVFNCTATASEAFSKTLKGEKMSPIKSAPSDSIQDLKLDDTPLSQWVVHEVKVQRKRVLIAIHVQTRFSMVFCHLKKGDWAGFVEQFIERLLNLQHMMLEDLGLDSEAIFNAAAETFTQRHCKVHFCKRSDRSVIAHINDVSWYFGCQVDDIGYLPETQEQMATFDLLVNGQFRKTKTSKDFFFPDEEMCVHWAQHYCHLPPEQMNQIRPRLAALRNDVIAAQIESMMDTLPEDTASPELDLLASTLLNHFEDEQKPVVPAENVKTSSNVIDLAAFREKRHK